MPLQLLAFLKCKQEEESMVSKELATIHGCSLQTNSVRPNVGAEGLDRGQLGTGEVRSSPPRVIGKDYRG